jgi:steroid delta-isomerase-like uncharacterized protein
MRVVTAVATLTRGCSLQQSNVPSQGPRHGLGGASRPANVRGTSRRQGREAAGIFRGFGSRRWGPFLGGTRRSGRRGHLRLWEHGGALVLRQAGRVTVALSESIGVGWEVIPMADAKQVVEHGWQSYIQHDLDSLLEVYAEDAVLTVPGARPAEGREAIGRVWSSFLGAFPNDSPTIERILADGDTVIVEFRSGGTNSGPLLLPTGEMLPATGRHVELQGISISDVEGGRIKRETFYWDTVSFLTQLGLIPEAAALPTA